MLQDNYSKSFYLLFGFVVFCIVKNNKKLSSVEEEEEKRVWGIVRCMFPNTGYQFGKPKPYVKNVVVVVYF